MLTVVDMFAKMFNWDTDCLCSSDQYVMYCRTFCDLCFVPTTICNESHQGRPTEQRCQKVQCNSCFFQSTNFSLLCASTPDHYSVPHHACHVTLIRVYTQSASSLNLNSHILDLIQTPLSNIVETKLRAVQRTVRWTVHLRVNAA